MNNFHEGYGVFVTGKVVSEQGEPHVTRLQAVIATVYPAEHEEHHLFKVWPANDSDPQLPARHNGKLWFDRNEATVEVVSDSEGNVLPKKVYLDDVRDTPQGWVRTYCPHDTIEHLKSGWVSHLSLDHDLGDESPCNGCNGRNVCGVDADRNHGYTVLVWLEEQVVMHGFAPPKHITAHSDNASAREKMLLAIGSIHKRAKTWVEGA